MTPVKVIGAGISGLSVAFYLHKLGIPVEIFADGEGLIQTKKTAHGLVETAANGFLDSDAVLELAREINIELCATLRESRKRYFFYHRLTRWPLTVWQSLIFAIKLLRFLIFKKNYEPRPNETLKQWTVRTFGLVTFKKIVSTAVQGIYAGNTQELSASLLLKKLFKTKARRLHTVAPREGMGAFIEALKAYLVGSGIPIHNQKVLAIEPQGLQVVATDLYSAQKLIPQLLEKVEILGLVSATLFFKRENCDRPEGFGVLFSPSSDVRGVLLNECIFENRSECWSETWILGGYGHQQILQLNQNQLLDLILRQRQICFGSKAQPLSFVMHYWPQALPHYTITLEQELDRLRLPDHVFLVGNYLGQIGLSALVERAKSEAQKVSEQWHKKS